MDGWERIKFKSVETSLSFCYLHHQPQAKNQREVMFSKQNCGKFSRNPANAEFSCGIHISPGASAHSSSGRLQSI
jgi:hypothetical protein